MSNYRTSSGEWISKKKLDREIERAKNDYTEFVASMLHIDPNNISCERCKKSNRICTRVSRSHIISVDWCQRTARAELAYDILNFEHLGQKCHEELEANTNELREQWYNYRQNGILNENELKSFSDFLISISNKNE